MATIANLTKSGNVEGNQAYKHFPSGGMFVRKATITTGTLVVNDVIQCLDVFAGETLHGIRMAVTDIDSGTAIVLDVGYGNSATATAGTSDDLVDGSTIGQAGGFVIANVFSADEDGGTAFAAGPLDFAADDTIDVHVQVAPGTSVAGTITIYAYIT
tara:strand:- start:744 stop:1214 length:471 start_codon:yes stop_codon:yes gene_type:complete